MSSKVRPTTAGAGAWLAVFQVLPPRPQAYVAGGVRGKPNLAGPTLRAAGEATGQAAGRTTGIRCGNPHAQQSALCRVPRLAFPAVHITTGSTTSCGLHATVGRRNHFPAPAHHHGRIKCMVTPPPRRRWFQFGLAQMISAFICLSIDAAIVASCVRQSRGPFDRPVILMPLWYALPVVGTILGLGIGLLVERPRLFSLLGFVAAVAYCLFILAALGFPPILPRSN
jgi:hypothetical protein